MLRYLFLAYLTSILTSLIINFLLKEYVKKEIFQDPKITGQPSDIPLLFACFIPVVNLIATTQSLCIYKNFKSNERK